MKLALAVMTIVAASASAASAIFMRLDEPVPIDRLLANLTAHVEDHPDDAEGHYVLGRVHSLAYAKLAYGDLAGEADTVNIIPAEKRPVAEGEPQPELPGFPPYASVQVAREGRSRPGDAEAPAPPEPQRSPLATAHLQASLAAYRRAVTLDDADPLYQLGLGWMSEQAARYGQDAATRPTTQSSRPLDAAKAAYRRTIELAYDAELASNLRMMGVEKGFLATEAAENLLRLLEADGLDADEQAEAQTLRERLALLREKPVAMTPILFATRDAGIAELLDPAARTSFDLAADGLGHAWPWVTPEANLLVWDPAATGRITSGTQLIGTRTWSMVFRDGYAALAALDDDADGLLRGDELAGLAAWCDRDGNGVSDPGEVRPLADLGIASLAVAAESHALDDVAAWSPKGLTLIDGRVLPTWDWMPTSHGPAAR